MDDDNDFEDITTCSICFERFTFYGVHVPRRLECCGKIACQFCISSVGKRVGHIECPFCRHAFSHDDVEKFGVCLTSLAFIKQCCFICGRKRGDRCSHCVKKVCLDCVPAHCDTMASVVLRTKNNFVLTLPLNESDVTIEEFVAMVTRLQNKPCLDFDVNQLILPFDDFVSLGNVAWRAFAADAVAKQSDKDGDAPDGGTRSAQSEKDAWQWIDGNLGINRVLSGSKEANYAPDRRRNVYASDGTRLAQHGLSNNKDAYRGLDENNSASSRPDGGWRQRRDPDHSSRPDGGWRQDRDPDHSSRPDGGWRS